MNYKVVQWAMYDAPMLRTAADRPDVTARHVLQAMAEPAKEDGSDSFLGMPKIEYITGLDRRTIQRAQRRLEDAGLIIDTGQVRNGCPVWRLAVWLQRPASDWAAIEAQTEASKEAAAARKRRSRAKHVTHSDDVTDSDFGNSASQTSRTLRPDVTHSASRCHALSAAVTRREPPVEPETPPDGAGRSSTESQNTDALSALRAPVEPSALPDRLSSEDQLSQLRPEDPLPVVGTATIPGTRRDRGAREENSRTETAAEIERERRDHNQGCGHCQTHRLPCHRGAALAARWAASQGITVGPWPGSTVPSPQHAQEAL